MKEKHKKISYKNFEKYIDMLANNIETFLKKNNMRVDYVCPILRSGGVPATYIANKLNIIKFAPIQVKHISYKNGTEGYAKLLLPFSCLDIKKDAPVFLLIDGTCASGESSKICINEIKNKYKNAKIIYICIAKQYDSQTFEKQTVYEAYGFYFNGTNKFSKKKCKELNIEYNIPLYPWEILEQERTHPDDAEDNIYF
jgi:Predicted phosphoribosyltransferases